MGKQIQDNQVTRLLDLVPYLITNQGVTLEQIAKDFRISKADVLEDLNTLWMCGLPGYTPLELIDLSFDTGFVSIRNADVLSKPRKLTASEIGAIIVGLSILQESFPSIDVHKQAITDLIKRLSQKSNVAAPLTLSTDIPAPLRADLNTAIDTKKNLIISYHSFSRDEVTNREIAPFSIKFDETFEYLESYCFVANDFRSFRLDRILSCSIIGSSNIQVTETESPDENQIDLSLKILSNTRKVAETFNVKTPAQIHQGDEFVSSAYNLEWIIRTVSSLNSSAEVTRPLEVRSQVAIRAQRALELYI